MAKRKRLTPPGAGYLDTGPAPESKGMFSGPSSSPAPIAGVAREASAAAALEEMAETLTRARSEGRMVMALPLESVRMDYLVRDRLAVDDGEMAALVQSLRARGQQTPIEVADLGEDARPRYGLISGWRRCQALSRLAEETGEAPTVLALLRRPEQAADAYLAMVEENEIRVGLSHYERAHIVMRATRQGVYPSERAALAALFANASRPRRSKIGSFLVIVAALDGVLAFPEALGERLGLVLARALEDRPGLGAALRAALREVAPQNDLAELAVIEAVLAAPDADSGEAERATLIRPPEPRPDERPAQGQTGADRPGLGPRAGGAEVAPGIWMRVALNGDVAIGGAGVTPDLRAALRAWLAGQG